jgi:hypothetical protein
VDVYISINSLMYYDGCEVPKLSRVEMGLYTASGSGPGAVLGFHHGLCCVRVSSIALKWCGACFRPKFTLEDAIEFFHTFAPLEALPCV